MIRTLLAAQSINFTIKNATDEGGVIRLNRKNCLFLQLTVEVTFGVAGVKLTRTSDFDSVIVHFIPVSNPADGTGNRKDYGEHGRWNA